MPAVAFNHFNLRADKVTTAKLRAFYVEVVGMEEGWRPPFNFPGHWLYLGPQPVLHLVEDPTISQHAPAGSFDHVAFTCSGLAQMESSLRAQGVEYRRSSVPGTSQVQLFAKDPAGNGVEFNFAGSDA